MKNIAEHGDEPSFYQVALLSDSGTEHFSDIEFLPTPNLKPQFIGGEGIEKFKTKTKKKLFFNNTIGLKDN